MVLVTLDMTQFDRKEALCTFCLFCFLLIRAKICFTITPKICDGDGQPEGTLTVHTQTNAYTHVHARTHTHCQNPHSQQCIVQ